MSFTALEYYDYNMSSTIQYRLSNWNHDIVEQRTTFHVKGDIEYFITKPIIIIRRKSAHTHRV